MKATLFFFFAILLFSCTPKATQEQNDQFNSCKKNILDNKKSYLSGATSKENGDSLKEYLELLENCNLDQLVDKLEVAPEDINTLIYSVCVKADNVKAVKIIEDELLRTDSLIKDIDSRSYLDSLHLPGKNK